MRFSHPEPAAVNPQIYPAFIPFAGCPERCVFCAQETQTGRMAFSLPLLLDEIERAFSSPSRTGRVELAFYGGTFTALDINTRQTLLALASRLKAQGTISRVRCSTRPDAVTPEDLAALRSWGLDCVELGVQSFCTEPLNASRRNYTGETAYSACRMVRQSGLELGIQLMPGMPGMRQEHFENDIRLSLELKPEFMRLYPCLVLRNTPLEAMWRSGAYVPWSETLVLGILPKAMLALWERGIRIIRMGMAPEKTLEGQILAGAHHPALGQSLRSLALLAFIRKTLPALPKDKTLCVPRRFQGEFFGHKGSLKPDYAQMGISAATVRWWENSFFETI